MHAAATEPIVLAPKDLPKEDLDKEREIFEAQSVDEEKSLEITQKIVEGKIKKYLSEVSLTEQPFVKDPILHLPYLPNQYFLFLG